MNNDNIIYQELLREKLEAEWHDEDEEFKVSEGEKERRRLYDESWYW